MKNLLEKLAWKTCHITTIKTRFVDVKILEIDGNFVLIENQDKCKILLNISAITTIVEASEDRVPIFVPHDI